MAGSYTTQDYDGYAKDAGAQQRADQSFDNVLMQAQQEKMQALNNYPGGVQRPAILPGTTGTSTGTSIKLHANALNAWNAGDTIAITETVVGAPGGIMRVQSPPFPVKPEDATGPFVSIDGYLVPKRIHDEWKEWLSRYMQAKQLGRAMDKVPALQKPQKVDPNESMLAADKLGMKKLEAPRPKIVRKATREEQAAMLKRTNQLLFDAGRRYREHAAALLFAGFRPAPMGTPYVSSEPDPYYDDEF